MATLETPATATNGSANPSSPVPLDTIPISPAKDTDETNNEAMNADEGASQPKDGDDRVTVFHDAENFNVKHPLMHEWTLWFTKPPSGKVRFRSH
jgi:translation initiation factor 4E